MKQFTQFIAVVLLSSHFAFAVEQPVENDTLWELSSQAKLDTINGRFNSFGNAAQSIHVIELNTQRFAHAQAALNAKRNGEKPAPGSGRLLLTVGERLNIRLPFHSEPLVMEVHGVREEQPGIFAYTGFINHDSTALFTLVSDAKSVRGKLHYKEHVFIIEYDDVSNRQLIHSIDKRLIPPTGITQGFHRSDFKKSTAQPKSSFPSCSSYTPNNVNGNVRILFLHSPSVSSGITTLVTQIVAEHNQTAWSSGVEHKNYVSVAGIQQVNDEFTGDCNFQILSYMISKSGVFSNLDSQMASADADLAFLIVNEDPQATNGNDCLPPPLGRLGGVSSGYGSNAQYLLSTVTYALGDLTAPHELGHSLGGSHEFDPANPAFPQPHAPICSRGFIISANQYQTIQAGYDSSLCQFDPLPGPQGCVRVPLWSNPSRNYLGNPTGDATAFMARALNMTYPVVAEWDNSYPFARPGTPAPPVVTSGCLGFNAVDWSSISGVDHYQLFSQLSGQTSWILEYHGTGTFHAVSVPSGQTKWLQLRACNGNGCSSFSTPVTALYNPPCW